MISPGRGPLISAGFVGEPCQQMGGLWVIDGVFWAGESGIVSVER